MKVETIFKLPFQEDLIFLRTPSCTNMSYSLCEQQRLRSYCPLAYLLHVDKQYNISCLETLATFLTWPDKL